MPQWSENQNDLIFSLVNRNPHVLVVGLFLSIKNVGVVFIFNRCTIHEDVVCLISDVGLSFQVLSQ